MSSGALKSMICTEISIYISCEQKHLIVQLVQLLCFALGQVHGSFQVFFFNFNKNINLQALKL